MKRFFPFIWFLLITSVFAACKKEDAASNSYMDDYRFYVKGQIGDKDVEYYAGRKDYYMETDYQYSDSVVDMIGKLYDVNTPQKNAFVIRIRGKEKVGSEDQFSMQSAMPTGYIALRDQSGYKAEDGIYIYTFHTDTNYYGLNCYWQFQDGTSSTLESPTKVINLNNYETYDVKLSTNSPTGCGSSIRHRVNIKESCDATFNLNFLSGLLAEVNVVNRQGVVTHTNWYLNGNEIQLDSMGGQVTFGSAAEIDIKAKMEFQDGCSTEVERSLANGTLNSCMSDFTYTSEQKMVKDSDQLATAELIYYDENGKEYSSYYPHSEGNFRVDSYTDYKINEKNQQTVRFLFEMNGVLKSDDGDSLKLRNFFGSFAIAHP